MDKELREALAEPFPCEQVQWRAGPTNQQKTRTLPFPYVDARAYQDRLDWLGVGWEDSQKVVTTGDSLVITCHLTVAGVTRSDVGEAQFDERDNAATTAAAQAFKRACSKFGLGRYFYGLKPPWVDYDASKKRVSDQGLAKLKEWLASGGSPGQNGASSGGNGANGSPVPDSPQALLEAVNKKRAARGLVEYEAASDLLDAAQQTGYGGKSWPRKGSVEKWRTLGNAALEYGVGGDA